MIRARVTPFRASSKTIHKITCFVLAMNDLREAMRADGSAR